GPGQANLPRRGPTRSLLQIPSTRGAKLGIVPQQLDVLVQLRVGPYQPFDDLSHRLPVHRFREAQSLVRLNADPHAEQALPASLSLFHSLHLLSNARRAASGAALRFG